VHLHPIRASDSKRHIFNHHRSLHGDVVYSLARIIQECRCEAAETEARRGFSQVRATQAYLRSVEETEREKLRWARGSAAVVGVYEQSGLGSDMVRSARL
jgi:hypothetical protein